MPTEPITNTPDNALVIALREHAKLTVSMGQRPSPHILILGDSGTGKSTSIKTLPPSDTFIVNVENKTLPFPTHDEFKNQGFNYQFVTQIDNQIKVAASVPGIKYIIIDSFSKWLEMLMIQARQSNKGYDIFNYYNSQVGFFLEMIKKINNKIIILTGISQIEKIEQESGALIAKRFLATEGKVWLGKIEKEFALVLYTHTKLTPGSNPPIVNYQFATNTDGITSAKTPAGMFPYYIPNDLGFVVKKVEEYFKL